MSSNHFTSGREFKSFYDDIKQQTIKSVDSTELLFTEESGMMIAPRFHSECD
jgi:hypothetical protein